MAVTEDLQDGSFENFARMCDGCGQTPLPIGESLHKIRRGYVGVAWQNIPLPRRVIRFHRIPIETGILVISVEPNSSAQRAGLQEGDVLLAYDGHPTPGIDPLHKLLIESWCRFTSHKLKWTCNAHLVNWICFRRKSTVPIHLKRTYHPKPKDSRVLRP